MRALFVVDPLDRLDPGIDSRVGLMHAVQAGGDEVWVTGGDGLEVVDGRPRAWAAPVTLEPIQRLGGARWAVPDQWCKVGDPEPLGLADAAAVFVRTEPPVGRDYLAAAHVLDLMDRRRTALVNEPRGLRACSEHLVGLQFPDLVPPTVITARHDTIAAFLRDHGRIVLKPVDGFSGRGVFLLATGDLNLATIVETATEGGRRLVMAQPWLAGVAEGNKRLFVLDGQILGAAMRHLVPGDFRIRNPDGPAPVTERDRHVVERLRPMLRTHGLRLVGLDVIDDLLIEVNLTSVGALHKADALLGTTWCADVVERALTVPSW